MNNKTTHIILLLLLAFFKGMCADQPDIPNERYQLITDRTIYAAGEKILFRALNISPAAMKTAEWSRVLYLELMDATHVAVARGKYITGKSGSSGILVIPSTLQTGNYYLRAYTRWMRNYPPEEYASVGLVIINTQNPPARSGQQINHINSPVVSREAVSGNYLSRSQGIFGIKTDRDEYPQRSKVSLEIDIPVGTNPSIMEYSISVIPDLALEPRAYFPGNQEFSTFSGGSARFYPETRGITLSGRVMKNGRQEPCVFSVVHSSIIDIGSGYAGSRTNDLGEFHIVLPEMYGLLNLFIATEAENGEILIDNDYSTDHAGSVAAYYLPENERELATVIMFGAQVNDAYDPVPVPADTTPVSNSATTEKERNSFYGPPMKTIRIDDYVALPTLEEFIAELLPEINIQRKKGETSIYLGGMHPDLALYPPLILYDYIPVFDLEEFLKLTPEVVKRIELVNATFTRGDLTFGGIVSVFSRRGDFSGYQLSGASYFFDFEAYYDTMLPDCPDYSEGKGDLHMPDYRNTLFWEPIIPVEPGKKETFEFYTSDRPGEYSIVIRGVSPEGEILTGETSFRISTAYPSGAL